MVTAVVVATVLIAQAAPVQARPPLAAAAEPDLTVTVNAADFGLDPAFVAEEVPDFQKEIADAGSLAHAIKRRLEAAVDGAHVDSSAWEDIDFDGTVGMTADGAGMVITIPGSEIQALKDVTFWQNVGTWVAGIALGWVTIAACSWGLKRLQAPKRIISLVCTPLGTGITALVQGLFYHSIKGDLGEPLVTAELIVKTVGAAATGFLWEKWLWPWLENELPILVQQMGRWLKRSASWIGSRFGSSAGEGADRLGDQFISPEVEDYIRRRLANWNTNTIGTLSCDIYTNSGAPCVGAHSTVRALYSNYDGPLYAVQRASDSKKKDIRPVSVGGYADAPAQDRFCAGTSCVITKLYDQSPLWNDLTIEGPGGAGGQDHGADAAALPVTIGGHKVYGVDIVGETGYRNNGAQGTARDGEPEGMYMVASGTHVNDGCCFDYGNVETNTKDNGPGTMDAVNLGTKCYFPPCTGDGPWVEADLEDGLFSGGNGSNLGNLGNKSNFVTALLKNNGQTTYALKGGDAQQGGLSTWYDGSLPTFRPGYKPMQQEGAIVMGTGGDNSNASVGSFFEGVMTYGYPSDGADNAVQASIVAAGYGGNSAGSHPPVRSAASTPAGAAVLHDGYASVFTVNSSNGHLQESYLPKLGGPWYTQDLSAKYQTPKSAPGTKPVAVVHDGYTSVFTVDESSGHLRESYLPKLGGPWYTQDLSDKYHTPKTSWTPTAVVHDGYASVFTVNSSNGHLQETYLPKMGDPWTSQDLSDKYHTPQVQAGTSPVALVHSGYTSVYTVSPDHHLQETYLPKMGDAWVNQDFTAKFHTPPTSTTPTAVMHQGYASVYTVNDITNHLQETYLPALGDDWKTQDLSDKYQTPSVAPGTEPVAVTHTGYTSVYTVDQGSHHLQETFLPKLGDPWTSQDLSDKYHTPPTAETPAMLVHPASGGDLWTSAFTVDQFNLHLQETYLPAIGQPWTTQDLTTIGHTPPVAETQFPIAGASVAHDGHTSVFSADVDTGHLWETYLPAMGQGWVAHDLKAIAGTPEVELHVPPVSLTHDGYTSVFTVDDHTGHLWETYLPALGQLWVSQDLSVQASAAALRLGTAPAAVVHAGYVSVYTVDADGHLWEYYLSELGGQWRSQDLSVKYGAPQVAPHTSPSVAVHSGWTSVFTIDNAPLGDLQETYLNSVGNGWVTQNLSAKYGIPKAAPEKSPVALFHSGYTSVYTVEVATGHLRESYLPAVGYDWVTQDLSAKYGTPAVMPGPGDQLSALYHNGFASVYTVNASDDDLQETYLPAIGDAWGTQDLTEKSGAPKPAFDVGPSVVLHYDTGGGLTWTSIFTVDISPLGDVQETYLPAIGDTWHTQDLTAKYGTPKSP